MQQPCHRRPARGVTGRGQRLAQVPQRATLALGTLAHRIAGRLGAEQIHQRRREPSILPFTRGAPAASAADALRRAVGKAGPQFALATRNGVAVQPGGLGKPLHAATALAGRLKRGEPAALLLIETAEQKVDLPVQQLIGMRVAFY
jgi:hypothetical protein